MPGQTADDLNVLFCSLIPSKTMLIDAIPFGVHPTAFYNVTSTIKFKDQIQ